MAGLADVAGTTETSVLLFAEVNVYDRDSETTTTLYWGECAATTDVVDGTMRDWEYRINGWESTHPDQQIGGSRFAHAAASLSVRLGPRQGDHADSLWDYFTDDHVWALQSIKLYLVDISQDGGDGAREDFNGVIRARPSGLRENSFFKLPAEGNLWRVKAPNPKLAMASEWWCDFIQPVVWTTNTAVLSHDVSATDTAWTLGVGGAGQIRAGMVGFIWDAVNGGELVYIEASDAARDITVKRGYLDTAGVPHGNGDFLYCMVPGPSQMGQTDEVTHHILPFVGGTGSADRGVHDLSDCVSGRARRTATGDMEVHAAAGYGPRVMESWFEVGGNITNESPTTYNDWNDVNGTVVAWGADPGAANTGVHLQPHPHPTSTYFEGAPYAQYKSNQVSHWARIRGMTVDNTEGGVRLKTVADLAWHLVQDSNYGLGLTWGDHFDTSAIDGYLSGDWDDEYTEGWWEETAWTVPQYGTSDPINLMDALQEGADVDNADWFVRAGLLYPKRRKVAGTADATIDEYDLGPGHIERLDDPQDIYCNLMVCDMGVPLWSEPSGNDAPVRVPFRVLIADEDEIDYNDGELIEKHVHRDWFYKNLFEDWKQQTPEQTTLQVRHLETWAAAHQEQLAMRAQPQVWLRAHHLEHAVWLQQGDTIDFNVTGITTRSGQVREVRKRRAPSQGGALPPIQVETTSWHISFPT